MATVGQPGASAMRRITVHYANSPTGNTGEDNLEELDEGLLQFVLGQEGLHQSILDEAYNNQNHMRATAPPHHSQSQYSHGESSSGAAVTSAVDEQIASDFEYARQLQAEMEDMNIEDDDISCVPSPSDTDDDDHEHNEEEADRQEDNEDPDNMTYEQRQALVESVGAEARGLSDEFISFLEPWKYKTSGFFSRKTSHENCPICLNTFKHGDSLITLPCRHNYHADCVTTWLKIEKTCPVCKYEVFGPS
ncbi:hypothetical protein QOZ80_6BG0458660 [Eleusine coracana subsp. coracana]|nr:hypothetical protein QOZ80_6BG0458660 [Eleusine coracana subsp. coracana]